MKEFVLPVPLRSFVPSSYCVVAVIVLLSCLAPRSSAQQKKYPAVHTLDGAAIFRGYCASCHGADGKGHGPAAPALKVSVPDLTEITRRSGGDFPRVRIRNIIEGEESPTAHGAREMPVWGPVFHQIDADRDMGNVRVDNLASYIQSIQEK